MTALLPELREDIQLKQNQFDANGRPVWLIHDPSRNCFFEIDWQGFECLKRWWMRDSEAILRSINQETTLDTDEEDLKGLLGFLQQSELIQSADPKLSAALYQKTISNRPSALTRLLKSYLFFRVPLVHPEPLLHLFLPLYRALNSRFFAWVTHCVLLLGLFELSRHWDSFIHSFNQYLNLSSAVSIALIIISVKILHEFGHAFRAYDLGCRVPTMGVTFLVMFPVAYTDVTDSWKLRSSSERMSIGLAGIKTELSVAAWATFLWGLLPPSDIRDGLFLIATVTWIGTLFINASPFMRFDGYFVLMDFWNIPNLHQRASALGRWQLRRLFLGDHADAPEYLAGQQTKLIIFAYLTWLYRLIVLVSIAWLLYLAVPQPLGLLLAGIELYWFILKPIFRELKLWPGIAISSGVGPQLCASILLVLGVLFILLYPWRTKLEVQSVRHPQRVSSIEIPKSAQVISHLPSEQLVMRDQLILALENPDINFQIDRLTEQLKKTEWLLSNAAFFDEVLASRSELIARQQQLVEEIAAAQQSLDALSINAPFDGYYVPAPESLVQGSWVGARETLGTLYSLETIFVTYLNQVDMERVGNSNSAVWQSEDGTEETRLKIARIDTQAAVNIDEPLLLMSSGGDFRARKSPEGWIPEETIFRVEMTADQPLNDTISVREVRGFVTFSVAPLSAMMRFWRTIRQTIQRDFGI